MDNPNFIANAIRFIQSTVTSNSITIQPKQPWQPSVMVLRDFEKEWVSCFNHSFLAFFRDHRCKSNDPQFSISMSEMAVKDYSADIRCVRNLFAPLPEDLSEFEELLIYFPPEYTVNALEEDVKALDISQYDSKMVTTINNIGQELGAFLHRNFPEYYFEILSIGSRSYGAYSPSTDFNYCVVMDDPDLDWIVQNKKTTNRQLLMSHPTESEDMAKLLTAHAAFKKGSYDVAVNTLRYQDPLGHVEFVFNKKIFTESTDLINHYIALDPRVGKLVAVVKNFVQLRSVAKGGLHGGGFYQYCIMVLAYLQQLDPPIIPNLQHLGFGNADCCRVPNCRTNRKYWDLALHEKKHVGAASYYHTCVTQDTSLPQTRYCVQQDGKGGYYWNSSSTARIGELILGFFYYYGFEFNFRRNGVSLKNGGVVEKLKGQPYFYIEDPFLAGVNVADSNKIGRGISFFLGAFIIMYNDENSFSEALRYSGLLQIPEMKRLVTTKVPFKPLPRGRMPSAGAVCFLLTNLPRVDGPDAECLCNEIEAEYRNIGNLLYMESLDSITKRVYIALRNHVNSREVQLPNRIKLRNKVVHVTKMYGFSVKN